MPDLRQIIKVTKAQMETLLSGGTVGGYKLQDDVLYAVEDDGTIPLATNTEVGGMKTGYSRPNTKSNNYPVKLDNGKAYTEIDVIDCGD